MLCPTNFQDSERPSDESYLGFIRHDLGFLGFFIGEKRRGDVPAVR